MNVEKLYSIAQGVTIALAESDTLAKLVALENALQTQVNDPGTPEVQQAVIDQVITFRDTMMNDRTNDFSPGWRQILEEMGVAHLLGSYLADRVDEIVRGNPITVAVAQQQMTDLRVQVESMSAALHQLISAFEYFRFRQEDLQGGEAEAEFLIPRSAVHNDLGALGNEFRRVRRVLAPFQELSLGHVPEVQVRSIASSDFSLLLELEPQVVDVLAPAIAAILTTYKQILELRRMRQALADMDVPADKIVGITDHANDLMAVTIENVGRDVMERYGENVADEGRRQELVTSLQQSLADLATRIDLGYHIDLRIQPGLVDEDNRTQADDAADRAFEFIQNNYDDLSFIRLEGDPILTLSAASAPGAEVPTNGSTSGTASE